MDSETIQRICSNNVMLRSCFLGVVRFKDLETQCLKNVGDLWGFFDCKHSKSALDCVNV